jgi:uncharacterized membrane protein YdbT with pleckstrin-like domain
MRTTLQKSEQILLLTRTSWVVLLGPALFCLTAGLISYFIGFIDHYGWIAAVIGLVFFMVRYFQWKVNIWVVTSFRVIDEMGLLSHFAKESPLDKINNVSYDQGIWGRILNFGHVEIQTAAQIGVTDYYRVHRPRKLKDCITQAQSDYKRILGNSQAEQMAQAIQQAAGRNNPQGSGNLASELEKLFDLRQKGILSEEEYQKAKNRLLNH